MAEFIPIPKNWLPAKILKTEPSNWLVALNWQF